MLPGRAAVRGPGPHVVELESGKGAATRLVRLPLSLVLHGVDAEHGRVGIEDDARCDDWPGETAAADFVRPRDTPKTKIAEPALD